jgi:predicted TIM-barrel fold metal-dependent hydrolase
MALANPTETWVETTKVVDVDAHIVEPYDLFTTRVPQKFRDHPDVPRVELYENIGLLGSKGPEDTWFVANQPSLSVGMVAAAGWKNFYPDRPSRFEEIADPAIYDARQRLERMDEYGLHAQVCYPNIGGFASWMSISDEELREACVRAYNDFVIEWASADADRLVPMMGVPFWNVPAAVAEMERCAELGFKGMFFGSRPETVGLPRLTSRSWDPIWATAQDLGWSINFHIGFNNAAFVIEDEPDNGQAANIVKLTTLSFLSNAHMMSDIIISGMCHRFPRLNFVSVESGAGYIPFLLDSLDWQWKNTGVPLERPEYDLLPSEYFRRQIYCSFWFETDPAKKIFELIGPGNVMYETDFPHPTSMSPGPGSAAQVPRDFMLENFSDLDAGIRSKVFHDNAARVYSLA